MGQRQRQYHARKVSWHEYPTIEYVKCIVALFAWLVLGYVVYTDLVDHGSNSLSPAMDDQSNTDPSMDALRQAFEQKFFLKHSKVQLMRSADKGWTVKATKAIGAEEMFFSIPQSLAIKKSKFEKDHPIVLEREADIAQVAKNAGGSFDEQCQLAWTLLAEVSKGQQSFWAPYIAMLPAKTTMVWWCSDEEAECLPPKLQDERKRIHKKVRAAFAAMEHIQNITKGRAFNSRMPKFEDLLWALDMVKTRAFDMMGEKGLIPWADFINHNPRSGMPMFQWNDTTNGPTSYFMTTQGFDAGEEVFDLYGTLSMQNSLFDYGFLDNTMVNLDIFQTRSGCLLEAPICLTTIRGNAKALVKSGMLNEEERLQRVVECTAGEPFRDWPKTMLESPACLGELHDADSRTIIHDAIEKTIEYYENSQQKCDALIRPEMAIINQLRVNIVSSLQWVLEKRSRAELPPEEDNHVEL